MIAAGLILLTDIENQPREGTTMRFPLSQICGRYSVPPTSWRIVMRTIRDIITDPDTDQPQTLGIVGVGTFKRKYQPAQVRIVKDHVCTYEARNVLRLQPPQRSGDCIKIDTEWSFAIKTNLATTPSSPWIFHAIFGPTELSMLIEYVGVGSLGPVSLLVGDFGVRGTQDTEDPKPPPLATQGFGHDGVIVYQLSGDPVDRRFAWEIQWDWNSDHNFLSYSEGDPNNANVNTIRNLWSMSEVENPYGNDARDYLPMMNERQYARFATSKRWERFDPSNQIPGVLAVV